MGDHLATLHGALVIHQRMDVYTLREQCIVDLVNTEEDVTLGLLLLAAFVCGKSCAMDELLSEEI